MPVTPHPTYSHSLAYSMSVNAYAQLLCMGTLLFVGSQIVHIQMHGTHSRSSTSKHSIYKSLDPVKTGSALSRIPVNVNHIQYCQ